MRWIPFFILLYVMTALQVSDLGKLALGPVLRIEYLPMLAVFYALFADEPVAPLCGLICGTVYDVCYTEPLGLYGIPIALLSLAVVKIRMSVFREHIISQLVLTVLAILAFAILAATLGWATGAISASAAGHVLKDIASDAFYTGVLAPAVFWLLLKLRGFWGFDQHRGRSGR